MRRLLRIVRPQLSKRLTQAFALVVALSVAVEASAVPPTAPRDADDLFRGLRGMTGLQAHFREEKHMSILAVPLISEGDLFFLAPDRVARVVTKPAVSSMTISGGRLSFHDKNGTQTMSLDENQVAKLFVDGIVKILAGDAGALQRLYGITFSASNTSWEARLKPRVAPMNKVIDVLELKGHGLIIDRLRVAETSGDETITTFTDVNAAREFSSEERDRLFSLPR